MKNLFLLLFWPAALFSQTEIFRVETIETNLSWKENPIFKLEHYSPYFYEDESYSVSSQCSGEFGGRIFFRNKKSGAVNIAYATCAVIMHKFNNKYHLTTSLDHGTGFYEIYEIDDPNELTVQVNDTLYYDLVDIRNGMKQVAGGVDKTILMSFPYKSQLYYIVSDREKKECYVAIREKALLKKVQKVTNLQLQSMHINALLTSDGHYAAEFSIREENRLRSGYIDIFENNIKIYLCE